MTVGRAPRRTAPPPSARPPDPFPRGANPSAHRGQPVPAGRVGISLLALSRGRRHLATLGHWAGFLLIAGLLAIGAAAVAAGLLMLLVITVGWPYLAGVASGVGLSILTFRFVGSQRYRKLRELLDWMGEDLEARKQAELRARHRVHVMRGQLP